MFGAPSWRTGPRSLMPGAGGALMFPPALAFRLQPRGFLADSHRLTSSLAVRRQQARALGGGPGSGLAATPRPS